MKAESHSQYTQKFDVVVFIHPFFKLGAVQYIVLLDLIFRTVVVLFQYTV